MKEKDVCNLNNFTKLRITTANNEKLVGTQIMVWWSMKPSDGNMTNDKLFKLEGDC